MNLLHYNFKLLFYMKNPNNLKTDQVLTYIKVKFLKYIS